MAQVIQLPVEIDLKSSPRRWTVARADYLGWTFFSNTYGMLRVVEPAEYENFEQKIDRDDLPENLQAGIPSTHEAIRRDDLYDRERMPRLHKASKPTMLDVLICDWPGTKRRNKPPLCKVDGWRMRDDFLSLKPNLVALAQFLNKYGAWNYDTDPCSLNPYSDRREPQIVLPEMIWLTAGGKDHPSEMQDTIRWGLMSAAKWVRSGYPTSVWMDGFSDRSVTGIAFEWQDNFPHFAFTTEHCLDTILATITIDHLKRAKFRLCARHDCRIPYAVQSQHRRRYCTQYCAHLESVRKQRREAKQQARKA